MKKVKLSFLLSLFAFVLSSGFFMKLVPSDDQISPIDSKKMGEILSKKLEDQSIDRVVDGLTDLELYSTVISTDNLVEIIYKPSNFRGDPIEGDTPYDINSREWQSAKSAVLSLVQSNDGRSDGQANIKFQGDIDDVQDPEDAMPILVVEINDLNTITALRRSSNVQSISLAGLTTEAQVENVKSGRGLAPGKNKSFLEGLGYDSSTRDGGGSDGGAGTRGGGWGAWFGCVDVDQQPASVVNLLPDANGTVRVPWHYEEMGILEANECSGGAGVKITLLDTGVSQTQPNLSNAGFNATYPSRTISRTSTVSGGVWDQCGHGTQMAGVIAGPKRNSAVRGVAYESNLVSIRSNKDVLLLTWPEKNNLRQALKKIRKSQSGTGGTKVVSMSLGYLFYSGMVAFELKKVDKKGILMFAAIGTSSFPQFLRKKQIYPAKSKRVSGVTGVYSGYPGVKKECDRCHFGNKVDFVVPMQLPNPDGDGSILTHTLMNSGYEPAKVGGSSIATATMAGVAAMVWALPENHNKDDEEIRDILIAASSHPNNKHSKFGYGVVDVMAAVGCGPPDPCDGVSCPTGQQCIGGNCITVQGNECNNNEQCPPGTICDNGYCVFQPGDACGPGFPCPPGEKCIQGNCIPL